MRILEGLRCWGFLLLCSSLESLALAGGPSDIFDLMSIDAPVSALSISSSDAAGTCTSILDAKGFGILEALDRALCVNPTIRQAWATARLRAAQIGTAEAAFFPTMGINAQFVRSRPEIDVLAGPSATNARNQFQRNFTLAFSWVIFDSGLRAGNLLAQKNTLNSAKALILDRILTVSLDVGKTFYDWAAYRGSLDAAKKAEELAAKTVQLVIARRRVGSAALLDQLQAESIYGKALVERLSAEASFKASAGLLSGLLQLRAERLLDADPLISEQPFVPNWSLDEFRILALTSSASLKSAAFQVSSNKARVQAAEAANSPAVTFNLNYAKNAQLSSAEGQSYLLTVPAANIVLSIPLFDGGVRDYQRHAAESQVLMAEAAEESIRQQVAVDAENSYVDLQMRLRQFKATWKLFRTATETFRVAERRYALGVGNLQDLLLAQAALAGAESDVAIAKGSLRKAQFKVLNFAAEPIKLVPADEEK